MEACDESKKNCLLIHGNGIPSFCKVMTDNSCLQVLFFPPMFAGSISHLTDQETYLEDSSGLRWRVTVCNHNGSLAFRQGWPEFSSEHGLNVGDILVFRYVPSDHFLVQIFGSSDCEKIMFGCHIGKGKKRARTYPEETTPVEKSKEASQFDSGEEDGNGNEKVIKNMPSGSGDAPSHNAVNYSCVVEVDGRDFLELPESWRHLLKKPKRERWTIFLQGPDRKTWPVLYHHTRVPFKKYHHTSSGFDDVLTSGWKEVAAAYGVSAGDFFLFELANQQEYIFDVRKI